VHLTVAAWLLLAPTPEAPAAGVGRLLGWFQAIGFTGMRPATAEFWANVAVFVPGPVLAALALPRVRPVRWALLGLLASCLVETVQGLVLPARSATLVDVVANTLGACLGALLAAVLVRRLRPSTPSPCPVPTLEGSAR